MPSFSGIWTSTQQMQAIGENLWPAVPDAPTIGTATAGNTTATVTFTAPAYLGIPATITSFTATSNTGISSSNAVSPITVTGLTNDVNITFTVAATNATGTGPSSAASNGVTPTLPLTANYHVVAGGGGGGGNLGGGGGAGGYRTSSGFTLPSSFTVTVGAGGAGWTSGPATAATQGNDSVFSTITSLGGGRGPRGATGNQETGFEGGSGSGGASSGGGNDHSGGPGTPGQGNAGGSGYPPASDTASGGGGGAGAVGGNGGASYVGASGGTGLASSITGTNTYYAGGGGGAIFGNGSASAGGSGGGGNGSATLNSNGGNGTTNTGGGGAGGNYYGGAGGTGGSGIVVISYPTSFPDLTSIGGGLTYTKTTASSNTIYTFTAGTGTVTV